MTRDFSLCLFPIIKAFIIGCAVFHVAEVKGKKIDLVVAVFHFILPHWGAETRRNNHNHNCDKQIKCKWFTSHDLSILTTNLTDLTRKLEEDSTSPSLITLSMYNIHSLWEKYHVLHPLPCLLSTNISLYSTEESSFRYQEEFRVAQHNFDAFSSTHPQSDIPRVYESAMVWGRGLLPLQNFSSLIKGGAYVASDCHKKDGANSHRDLIASQLREFEIRIDGLGKCLHTKNIPEGVRLPKTKDRKFYAKRQAINRYAFTLAFENSIEDGYVTEKVFDALMAGTVPIYLGDSSHAKTLLPHPKAVIFVDDFPSVKDLSIYIKSLLSNETAYEIHRGWRNNFNETSYRKGKPLLEKSWKCHVCEWAAKQFHSFHHITSINSNSNSSVSEGGRRSPGFERSHRIGNRRCNEGPPPLLLKPKKNKKNDDIWSYFLSNILAFLS